MFITFEGVEGAGKSTQIRCLADILSAKGYPVVTTREPGAGHIGQQIRQIILADHQVVPEAELLLYAADRAQHVRTLIRPALAEGKVVVCDRYADSTVAYQGYGRGLPMATIETLNQIATGGLKPDFTVLLDLDPAAGLARSKARALLDRMEQESLAFHQRVRHGFLQLARQEPDRFQVFDALGEVEDICEAIWQTLAPHLPQQVDRVP